jgi:hypothetical protein
MLKYLKTLGYRLFLVPHSTVLQYSVMLLIINVVKMIIYSHFNSIYAWKEMAVKAPSAHEYNANQSAFVLHR